MHLTEVNRIENYKDYSYNFWTQIIESGYIIYRDELSIIRILDCKSFEVLFELKIGNQVSFGQWIKGNRIFFSIQNDLFEFDSTNRRLELVFSTDEESAGILWDSCKGSKLYFTGRTFKRKPRVCSYSILDSDTKEKVYSTTEQNYLVHYCKESCIFQKRFSGTWFMLDLNSKNKLWEIEIDEGIPGRRWSSIKNNSILTQIKVNKEPTSWDTHIQSRNLNSGELEWLLRNTFHQYHELSPTEYIGVGGNRIHGFNTNGVETINKEISRNVSISSHLSNFSKRKLIFSSHINRNIPVLGIVNTDSLEIELLEEIFVTEDKSSRNGLDVPYIRENFVYVRDTEDRLRIFKLEE